MIIWINGAFGAGKTQAAYALHRLLPDSYVFDPEEAGFYIRANLPEQIRKSDFQEHSVWRDLNHEMLRYIVMNYTGVVIIPMTITDRGYFNELTAGLSALCPIRHFILMASKQTVLKRLAKRWDGKNSWPAKQLPRCMKAFEQNWGEKLATDGLTPEETAMQLAALCGLSVITDDRFLLRRKLDRLLMQCRHLRK